MSNPYILPTPNAPPPNGPGRTSPVAARKRKAILDAALSEFEAHGFGATSMDRIAHRAGVSKRTVYNHFAGKEALFEAIIDALSDKVGETARLEFRPDVAVDVQLRDFATRFVEMLASPYTVALARVALAEMLRSPAVAARVYTLMRARQAGLSEWLESAHRHRCLFVPDSRLAADQLLGLLKAFAFWPHMLGGQPIPDMTDRGVIVTQAVDLLMRRYAPEEGRSP
jgi:TetR/AcrR family transcriptional regulator of autoinduction and epiphytic fitness